MIWPLLVLALDESLFSSSCVNNDKEDIQEYIEKHASAKAYACVVEIHKSPGGEVSGIVTKVGAEVTSLKEGQRVIGSCGWGGFRDRKND